MLDVKDITEQIENLWCNLINVMMCMNMMKNLLKMFNLKYFAIISLYRAQQKVYHHTIY